MSSTESNHGYRGLYNGETAKDIHKRKGLAKGEQILNWMGSEELAANLFRSTQAEARIRREGIKTKEEANQAHYEAGKIVRQVIIEDFGGTPPELLPTPKESIQQLEARKRRQLERERQPSLFPELEVAATARETTGKVNTAWRWKCRVVSAFMPYPVRRP